MPTVCQVFLSESDQFAGWLLNCGASRTRTRARSPLPHGARVASCTSALSTACVGDILVRIDRDPADDSGNHGLIDSCIDFGHSGRRSHCGCRCWDCCNRGHDLASHILSVDKMDRENWHRRPHVDWSHAEHSGSSRDSGDADIVYDVVAGSGGAAGRPPLMMIGQPMDASGFRALAFYFPDRVVVTYDPRGVGRSTRHDGRTDNRE